MANPSQTLNEDNNGQGLWITHYLKLDGFIDLVGKSQLLQKKYNAAQIGESILDATSSGYIERDQKGQKNHFNYNYWSSPVSPINTVSNNTNYSVSGVMKDGTTTTPQDINWIGGLNGAPTSPISLARRWLYKFDNYSNAYANWAQISENDPIRVGQGYIFKGTGAATANQNYTFKGKPNNGTIASNTVSSDQLLLAGNPYPSALNANKFINDNVNSTDGTIYFWEHYSSNTTHILRDYEGGYAEI
jgi:trimeric autotransporter adhesin